MEGLFPERLGCSRIGKSGLFQLQCGRARRRILGADQPKQCAWKYGIQPTPGFLIRIIDEAIWTNLKNVSKHKITTWKKRKIWIISKVIIYHYKFIRINEDYFRFKKGKNIWIIKLFCLRTIIFWLKSIKSIKTIKSIN